MLRADNTSAIVIALQEPGTIQDGLHDEAVLLDLSKVSHCPSTFLSRADTPLLQVSAWQKMGLNQDGFYFHHKWNEPDIIHRDVNHRGVISAFIGPYF